MVMRLAVGVVVALFIASPIVARAANWVEVVADRDVTLLIDTASVHTEGDLQKHWLKYRWTKPQDYRAGAVYQSKVQQQVANCRAGSVAVIQWLLYSEPSGGEGRLLESRRVADRDVEFSDPAPGTFGEAALKFVCQNRQAGQTFKVKHKARGQVSLLFV